MKEKTTIMKKIFNHLLTILKYTLIGTITGTILCLFAAFISLDISVFNEISPLVRILAVLGFIGGIISIVPYKE